jgi:hypothetical protein
MSSLERSNTLTQPSGRSHEALEPKDDTRALEVKNRLEGVRTASAVAVAGMNKPSSNWVLRFLGENDATTQINLNCCAVSDVATTPAVAPG